MQKQLDRIKEMDPQELALTMAHFQKMLSETQGQFEEINQKPWEYKLPAKVYFGEVGGFNQISENPTDNSEHPSVVDSEDGQENPTHTDPDYDQFDQDDESVLQSLLNVSEGPYGSSSPDDCTHSTCANPKRGGGDCDDQIHKGKGKFKTTKRRHSKKQINYLEDRITPSTIPETASYLDLSLNQNYMRFDERIHIKIGPSKIEIVRCSHCKTYREKIQREVLFKTGDQSLFQFNKELDTNTYFPCYNVSAMKAALETYLQMDPSAEKLIMKYLHMLDTVVQHDSGFAKLCSSIKTMEKKTCSLATQLSPELLRN